MNGLEHFPLLALLAHPCELQVAQLLWHELRTCQRHEKQTTIVSFSHALSLGLTIAWCLEDRAARRGRIVRYPCLGCLSVGSDVESGTRLPYRAVDRRGYTAPPVLEGAKTNDMPRSITTRSKTIAKLPAPPLGEGQEDRPRRGDEHPQGDQPGRPAVRPTAAPSVLHRYRRPRGDVPSRSAAGVGVRIVMEPKPSTLVFLNA